MLKLADILEGLTGVRPAMAEDVIVMGAVDSRIVLPGGLFVAVPGENVDGHDYVADAFQRGASLAFVQKDMPQEFRVLDVRAGYDQSEIPEKPFCVRVENSLVALQEVARFYRSKIDVDVIGITGSVGKSTSKEVIAEVLSRRAAALKNPGNLNNEIGLPLTILQLTSSHHYAVLEMGFYVPGEIEFLCDIARPKIGVVTNIGLVHAERAGSQDVIAKGKAELVRSLPSDGTAVLNYDDPLAREMCHQTRAQILFYGLDPKADLWADQVEGLGLEGIRMRLHYRGEKLHLKVPMLGRHSVHTALRAAAVGLVEGLVWEEILAGLRFGHTQLRLMAVQAENGALLLDDTYNASPQSTLAALNLLAELNGHKIAVLGDMLELGQYERQGHEMVGFRCREVTDMLVVMGDRARMIAAAARRAGMPDGRVFELDTPEQVIHFLQEHMTADDVVLVKGSAGMKMANIVPSLEAQA
jgi:UDP-N-acetylmuramoyl-tripeptide--D-alanyl-D-alanine ligase